ncbi:MAG TPA: tetratricopeptide repeat protein, partial [Chloroflexia bacterium]|nr:tetratricopeptide repeat protein [Chloroflexia bacterium]
NKRGIATSLTNLGGAAWGRGDYATARALFEESLGLARELGHRSGIADSLCNLGEVLTAQGDFETARRLHEESLRIRQELEDRWGTAFSLEGLARLAYRQGAAARAVQLYGAAAALRQAIRSPLAPGDQTKQDVITTALRSQLGEVAYHDAWQRGHTLPLEAIVAVALETGLPASPTGAGRP